MGLHQRTEIGKVRKDEERKGASTDVKKFAAGPSITFVVALVLGRSGVEIISNDAIFDRPLRGPCCDRQRRRHRRDFEPGFAGGSRVL